MRNASPSASYTLTTLPTKHRITHSGQALSTRSRVRARPDPQS